MWFPVAIITSTLVTLTSIFAIYKTFLDKPLPSSPPGQQVVNFAPSPANTPTPQGSPTPKSSNDQTSSKSSSKPRASVSKASPIGTLTILQNNTSSSTNQTSNQTTGSSKISGTISLIGTPPSGSSLVVAARPTGSGQQFTVIIDGITAQNNAAWSWNQAQDGVRYDVFAVLKGKSGSVDIDYASSPSSTVTAPYQGQVLVVDIGYTLSAPTGSATVSCTSHLSNNSWNTTVNFPAVTGAKMYHVQIGTTSGGNDLLDVTLDAQSVTPNLNDSTNYYFRYSVASVSSPTAYQYSSYSSASTIRCP